MRSLRVALDADLTRWLEQSSLRTGLSTAELVRQVLRARRSDELASLEERLAETRGIWTRGDGMAYQNAAREEWEG